MRFTRIRLDNWKNFLRADVAIDRRLFIVGPNASGKSNFLDAFRFLNDIVSVGGGFQDAVQKRGGVSSIRCLAARRYPTIGVLFSLEDDNGNCWSYKLEFSQDKQRKTLVTAEEATCNNSVIFCRPDQDDRQDGARLTQTFLEQVNANKAFRSLATFFGSIEYLHVVPQLIREPDRSVGKKKDPFGGDFLEQLASTPRRVLEPRLERVRKALQVAVPQLERLELLRDSRNGTPHLRGKYSHWRPQGSWQSEDQFSDGTLRLIGLLWATLDGAGPLLLEEPELSLHSAVVRFLPRMFNRMQKRTGRQVFISTHSQEMLHDGDIGPEEVLVLSPGENGTLVQRAVDIASVMDLFEINGDLAEATIPLTSPKNASKFPLFAEQ